MCVTRHLMIIENENKNNLNNFSSHLIFLYSFVVHLVQGKALISGSDCRKLWRQMYCQWKLDTFRLNLLSKFTCIFLSELNLLSCQSLYLSWPLSLTHPRVTLAGTKTSCWSPDTLMNRCVHHTHMLHKKSYRASLVLFLDLLCLVRAADHLFMWCYLILL